MPSISSMASGYLNLGLDSTVNAEHLEVLGATVVIEDQALLNLPALSRIASSAITLNDGGSIFAPLATEFTYSSIALNPDRSFVVGSLKNISNSTLYLDQGLQWGVLSDNISAKSYSSSGLNQVVNWDGSQYNRDLFIVTGDDTWLDLSSLESIYSGFNDNNGTSQCSKNTGRFERAY